MADRTCTRCTGTFDEAFFRKDSKRCLYASRHRTRPSCIGCEQTARDAAKEKSRWPAKARDASRRHADRFIKAGRATSRAEFSHKFGWDVGRMAHEAEHAYSNGCGYCAKSFAAMGHGLADITLDVVDPQAPPYYGTNTKWVCQTCNREKGATPPALWGAKLNGWRQWDAWQEKRSRNPLAGLPLFDL